MLAGRLRMKAITQQKSLDEIEQYLDGLERLYIVGCGTCATMTRTGGQEEVLEMKDRLQGAGKVVTGWVVLPCTHLLTMNNDSY